MIKKICLPLFLAFTFLVLSFEVSLAAERCETLYGGGETCVRTGELQIDKKIWNPESKEYVDNFGFTSYKFGTAEEVKFKLIVKNVGDETLENIKVTDELPEYLFFTNGSTDTYYLNRLSPGDSWEFIVYSQVKAQSQLSDKSLDCDVINVGRADAGDEHGRDTAQLCITQKVLGAKILPKTGDNTPFIIFGASLAVAMLGFALIKVGKKVA